MAHASNPARRVNCPAAARGRALVMEHLPGVALVDRLAALGAPEKMLAFVGRRAANATAHDTGCGVVGGPKS
jgi:hypothetical protein